MGRRREGFLTTWQHEYVKGEKKVDETRRRVEDFYILKQWARALEQAHDTVLWLKKTKRPVFSGSGKCPICNAGIQKRSKR